MTPPLPGIVCFSHIPWDSVEVPRPREIFLRLAAAGHSVYYFECSGRPESLLIPSAGETVEPAMADAEIRVFRLGYDLDKRYSRTRRWRAALRTAWVLWRHRVRRPVIWFMHPALFALGYSHDDAAIVYDAAEDFSAWADRMPDIFFDELMLLAESDIVFANGPALAAQVSEMQKILKEEAAARGRGDAVELRPPVDVENPLPSDQGDWNQAAATIQRSLHSVIAERPVEIFAAVLRK